MYLTDWCPFCRRAKELLRSKGVTEIEEIRVELNVQGRAELEAKTGRRTVPQIYIGETHVGGCDELYALERAGKLDSLLDPA
jgi:glutaredoxin 3